MVGDRKEFLYTLSKESVPILYMQNTELVNLYASKESYLQLTSSSRLDPLVQELKKGLENQEFYFHRFFKWRVETDRLNYRLETQDQWDEQGFCGICRALIE